MKLFRTTLVAVTLAVTATPLLAANAPATRTVDTAIVRADEISAQRQNERRPARSYRSSPYNYAPDYAPNYAPPVYRGGPADPSIAPDGRPYRVPEYLRGQCYIDDGYGRFSACSNR